MARDWLEHFEDDAVRALAWCIGAPGLMHDVPGLDFPPSLSYKNALEEAWDWLFELDRNPTALHEHLAATQSWKVGVYFESLIAWWLTWSPQHDLLARNLQLRDEHRTFGEFDFLLRDDNGQPQHWEVAVKFYLQREQSDEWSAWVGPNQRDRLDIKLGRMRDHQLPLSGRPEAVSALESLHIAEPPSQVAIVKGMFFELWNEPELRPRGCAQEPPFGQWVTAGDFVAFSETHSTCRWCIREKPDWLGPARRRREDSFSTAEAVERLKVNGLERPQLWSRLGEREDDIWFEEGCLFVVPDNWRELYTSSAD
jgi:uncharacterized protein